MAEVVDDLAQRVATMKFIGCHLRHDEVALAQWRSLRVNANKDVCDHIDVKFL